MSYWGKVYQLQRNGGILRASFRLSLNWRKNKGRERLLFVVTQISVHCLLYARQCANGTAVKCVCILSVFALLFQEPLFAARVIYDLLFFFIVIIIVLNLIFGVIIDTFADLRSEKQKKEEILKTTCFICGRCPPPLLW